MLGLSSNFEQPSVEVAKKQFADYISDYGISYGTQDEYDFRF